MSDPWARPTGGSGSRSGERPEGSIEIELDGGDREPSQPDGETNWRKVIGVASATGVALGLVIAAVVFAQDDADPDPADEASSPSAVDANELNDVVDITTPPTLPPVVPDTTPATVAATVAPGPDPPPSPDTPIAAPPTFPPAPLPGDLLAHFVLDAETIAGAPAARVTIEIEDGALTLIVEHDAATDRYRTTTDQSSFGQEFLVDVGANMIYIRDGGEDAPWQLFSDSPPVTLMADQLRLLLLSPIRPDTLAGATSVAGDAAVVLDDGTVARRYDVVLPLSALPEFAGSRDVGGEVDAEAYVDEYGRLALVRVIIDAGDGGQLIVYRFDHRADVSIDVPTNVEPAPIDQSAAPADAYR